MMLRLAMSGLGDFTGSRLTFLLVIFRIGMWIINKNYCLRLLKSLAYPSTWSVVGKTGVVWCLFFEEAALIDRQSILLQHHCFAFVVDRRFEGCSFYFFLGLGLHSELSTFLCFFFPLYHLCVVLCVSSCCAGLLIILVLYSENLLLLLDFLFIFDFSLILRLKFLLL